MADVTNALRMQLTRQVAHWRVASEALSDLTRVASSGAWQGLEHYLGLALRSMLQETLERLRRQIAVVEAELRAAETLSDLKRLQRSIVRVRRHYLAAETIVDFYGDAINTRTNAQLGAYLAACDRLAGNSMRAVLAPLGHATPHVLTYVDKGLGASILKAGLRLWDGRSLSNVAAIKVVRHNLLRPTAILHEAGHQIAHITAWTEELAEALRRRLAPFDAQVAALWSGWASEAAADAFAFAHAGYASVAALHDVVCGDRASVMHVQTLDPHPASYLRVLLGCEMCRTFYGAGPWDEMARSWQQLFPLVDPRGVTSELLRSARPLLGDVVEILFRQRFRAFRGRALSALLDPTRVGPVALRGLEQRAGKALFQSPDWIERESLRLLALSGYRAATEPERAADHARMQEAWMHRLGTYARAA